MNGEVEEREQSELQMTHARAMWDECELELLYAFEPNSVPYVSTRKTVKGRGH